MTWNGTYFDGKTARRHDVEVRLGPRGIEIRGPGVDTAWPPGEIRRANTDGASGAAHFEYLGQTLVVEDPGFARVVGVHDSRRAATLLTRLALLTVVLLPVFAFAGWWIIPRAGEFLSGFVPVPMERKLGEAVVRQFGMLDRACHEPRLDSTVARIVSRLDEASGPSPYDIDVTVVRHPAVNALAAPAGPIVVFSALLETTASEAELAAVLAHEIAHVKHRHATRGIFRQMSVWAALAVLTGDISSAIAVMGTAGILHFVRADEAEADLAGLETLRRAGYSPAAMAAIFRKLALVGGEAGGVFRYLSTHPAIEDRVLEVEKRARGAAGDTGISGEEWHSLISLCP